MSALGLAIAVTARMGSVPAATRGEVAAASDFASLLDATTANDVVTTPAAQKTDAEAAPVETVAEGEDGAFSDIPAAETPVATAPIIPTPVPLVDTPPPVATEPTIPTPSPLIATPLPVATEGDTPAPVPAGAASLPASTPSVIEAESSLAPALPASLPVPPADGSVSAAPSVATPPALAPAAAPAAKADTAPVSPQAAPTADAPPRDTVSTAKPATGPAPTPKADAPAARTAAPASAALAAAIAALVAPPARASGTVGSAEGPAATEEPAVAEEAPPPPQPKAPVTDIPRTRDVIERAPGRPVPTIATEAQAAPAAKADTASLADAPAAASATTATATTPPPAAAIASTLVPIPTDIEAVAPSVGQAAQPTVDSPLEVAAPPSAPSASRASIETTVHIAAQIVRKLEGRSSRFEMALTPEGLGNVDVSLDIDADGKLVAKLAFDNPLAATEMRGRVDELRRQLQDSGFIVADDALSFTERDPSTGQGGAFDRRPDPRNARAFGAASRLEADADQLSAPARWIPLTLTPDRVDMKV